MGITGSAISVSQEINIAFKSVVTIICSEKLKVMIYLLVRLSIIDHVIKNTFINQLILVWTLI